MIRFHTDLARGVAPAAALQAAQRAIRDEHPHPYFWAAFAAFGRW